MDATPERLSPSVDATTPTTAEAIAILESHGDADASRLRALEDRKRELHEARRAVAKEVKKEAKKRRRIMEKAKGLSNETLLQVIVSRATAKANAKARATSSSSTRGGAAQSLQFLSSALHLPIDLNRRFQHRSMICSVAWKGAQRR